MQTAPGNPSLYRAFLERLATLTPPLFLMGGFAEDVLLQDIQGEHADLDVLVVRLDLHRVLGPLSALGWRAAGGHDIPGEPQVLLASVGDPPVELWACDPAPGGYDLDLPGRAASSRYRVTLPEDVFEHPATTIDGITLQTVSPLALYQLRAVSAMTRSAGARLERDLRMKERLRGAFLRDVDEGRMAPKLRPL
jgi:hypothetical protein